MNNINTIKGFATAIAAFLSALLGTLYIPVLLMVVCNIIDYCTGLCAAKYRSEHVNSYKSIRGIAKKICMWLLVAVGAMLDWLLNFAADSAGITIALHFVIASVAAVWLIANEIISILENINDIGAPLPPFLMKIAANIKSQTEDKTDISGKGDK